jgi:hypothetical protein
MADGRDDRFGDEDDEVMPREEGFAQRVIPDVVRRAVMTGVGAVLMGEEGVRNTLNDIKLPKEAMSYIVAQADKTKREAISTLARELREFLESLDLQSLLESSLAGTTVEIQTKIRIISNEEGGVGLEVVDKQTDVKRDEEEKAEAAAKKKAAKKKRAASKKKKKSAKKSD